MFCKHFITLYPKTDAIVLFSTRRFYTGNKLDSRMKDGQLHLHKNAFLEYSNFNGLHYFRFRMAIKFPKAQNSFALYLAKGCSK